VRDLDRQLVHGHVLVDGAGNADLGVPVGGGAEVDGAALDAGDPQRQRAVEEGVQRDRGRGVGFRGVKAELVVPEEGEGGEEEGRVADRETGVEQAVGLDEAEGVEVVGQGVVGGVFEVWKERGG
jgi:hypothetical protein